MPCKIRCPILQFGHTYGVFSHPDCEIRETYVQISTQIVECLTVFPSSVPRIAIHCPKSGFFFRLSQLFWLLTFPDAVEARSRPSRPSNWLPTPFEPSKSESGSYSIHTKTVPATSSLASTGSLFPISDVSVPRPPSLPLLT